MNSLIKIGKRPEQILQQRKYTDGKQAQEKMLLGNFKLTCNNTIYPSGWSKFKTLTSPNPDEAMEQQERSFIAGGNSKWYSSIGTQFDSFL
jgi:hypothetical protein